MDTHVHLEQLVHRMNRAYGCFMLWKFIRTSTSIPDTGKQEAERRTDIMNQYGGIFTGILYAVENSFINDLHKFFDKSKGSLKLDTLINGLPNQNKTVVLVLIKTIEVEIKHLETLRHNFTAHEPKNPQKENIYKEEIEKIFSVVQQILNIMSTSFDGVAMNWDTWGNNTDQYFSYLLNDLDCGYKVRNTSSF